MDALFQPLYMSRTAVSGTQVPRYPGTYSVTFSGLRYGGRNCGRCGRTTVYFKTRHRVQLFFFTHIYFPASGQAVVTGVVPSPPRFLLLVSIAHRVQQSNCSSIFQRVLLTRALALSATQFARKKKSLRIYTRMHSGGLELTKLTYTRLKDNLIRPRGDRLASPH